MYSSHYKIESIVKKILEQLGKEVDVKANLKTWKDREDLISGGKSESYVNVKGLKFHFDKMRILGYYYNDNYYFSVQYNYNFQKPHGCYEKKEDGKIINKNEEIWEKYLLELYDSIDDLVRNKIAEKYFFENYGRLIPWKKFSSYWSNEETKNYISELKITLFAKQWLTYGGNDSCEANHLYKIYDGNECVYDSEAEIFIDGLWKDNLIEYMLRKEEELKLKKELDSEKEFNKSLQRLRSIRKN